MDVKLCLREGLAIRRATMRNLAIGAARRRLRPTARKWVHTKKQKDEMGANGSRCKAQQLIEEDSLSDVARCEGGIKCTMLCKRDQSV